MKNNTMPSERIFFSDGLFTVYGLDDKLWYRVAATTATADDYSRMLETEPPDKPLTITNQNINAWRKQSTDKKK